MFINKKATPQTESEEMKMTRAERETMRAYKKDLIEQGIDKEVAEVMAKTFVEYQTIKPVVNSYK